MINLDFYGYYHFDNDANPNHYQATIAIANSGFANSAADNSLSSDVFIGSPQDPSNFIFTSLDSAFAYMFATYAANITSLVNNFFGSSIYQTGTFLGYIKQPEADVLADKSPLSHTHVIGDITNLTAALSKTFNNPTRSLNTAFQISTSKDALVSYTVDVSCTMSLTSGQSGTTVLEYADNSGFTTNVKTVCKPTASNSGSLTIGLNLTQINGMVLSGVIPANKYARIRTINNTGTPTFTLQNSQETLF